MARQFLKYLAAPLGKRVAGAASRGALAAGPLTRVLAGGVCGSVSRATWLHTPPRPCPAVLGEKRRGVRLGTEWFSQLQTPRQQQTIDINRWGGEIPEGTGGKESGGGDRCREHGSTKYDGGSGKRWLLCWRPRKRVAGTVNYERWEGSLAVQTLGENKKIEKREDDTETRNTKREKRNKLKDTGTHHDAGTIFYV